MLFQGEGVCVSWKMFTCDYLICEKVISILWKKIMRIRMIVLFGSQSGVKQFKKMYLMLNQRMRLSTLPCSGVHKLLEDNLQAYKVKVKVVDFRTIN